MLALKVRVRHDCKDAEIVGRCCPGRVITEFSYDLRYSDGTIKTNIPESEIKKRVMQ